MVEEVVISFPWHAGMSPQQKRKNVSELHYEAEKIGLWPILETSSKSNFEAGRRLSAFYLPFHLGPLETTVESVFQGSKVFENGGPFVDLYEVESRTAKLDERLQSSGRLIAFEFQGRRFPLSPPTVFYDWIYVTALYPHREWLMRLSQFRGFTDIEFNPARSVNCQARACALFVALQWRGMLDATVTSFESFLDIQSRAYL